jgi:hypothetical protein
MKTQRRVLGLEHLETLYSMSGLTNVYADEGGQVGVSRILCKPL